MSYILDALRKSEQERQLAEGKSAGVLYPVTAESRRSVSSGLAIAAAVAFGLAVAAGSAYFLLRTPKPASPGSTPPAQSIGISPPHQPTPPVAVTPPAPPVVAVETPVSEVVIPRPIVPVVPAPEKPLAAPSAKPEVGESRTDEMPSISISGYIRDDEAGGMAMINDKLVREGEEISPGLRLEKILPDGAVFSYKGRRFTR
jgi:general secretion pathway protein B